MRASLAKNSPKLDGEMAAKSVFSILYLVFVLTWFKRRAHWCWYTPTVSPLTADLRIAPDHISYVPCLPLAGGFSE